MKTIHPNDLHTRLFDDESLTIIDVLPDDFYEKRHLPSARNACVYEIEFLEKVATLAPDKDSEVVVYGQNDRFEAASLAAEKLAANGWNHVSALKGGLDAWLEAGFVTTGAGENGPTPSGIFKVDPERSLVRWVGRNLLNQHNGTVALKNASIALDDDRLIGGSAILDMTRIDCEDIEDAPLSQMLVDHLRTDDFFSVKTYPTADFKLVSAEPIPNATAGSPNYHVIGSFTLRGRTESITFPATLGINDEVIAFQAQFDIDRVLWGSKYGSGKIYEALGKHVVNDRISISLQLIAPIE